MVTGMDLIKWRESYETGIISMDTQHKKLIDLINKLYNVIRKNESIGIVDDVLKEMIKYGDIHLKNEEDLLKDNNYPDITNHIAQHQYYLEKLDAIMTKSIREKELAEKDTYAFLRQWWMTHIVAEDKKYGEFLKSKGAQ
jgi:hemerythrin